MFPWVYAYIEMKSKKLITTVISFFQISLSVPTNEKCFFYEDVFFFPSERVDFENGFFKSYHFNSVSYHFNSVIKNSCNDKYSTISSY